MYMQPESYFIDLERNKKLDELSNKRELELDSISNSLSDEDYRSEEDKIYSKYEKLEKDLFIEYKARKLKEIKNEWFLGFIESFGLCECKKISEKQANIFAKYGKEINKDNRFYGKTSNYLYELHFNYITIVAL